MEMLPQYYLNSHPVSENPFVSCAICLGYLNPHWDTCDTCVHFSLSGHSIVPYYTLPPPCTLFLMTTQRSSWSSIYGMSPAGPATEPWFQKQASWVLFLQAGALFLNARMVLIINWGPLILTGLRMNQGSIYPCFPTNNQDLLDFLPISGLTAMLLKSIAAQRNGDDGDSFTLCASRHWHQGKKRGHL